MGFINKIFGTHSQHELKRIKPIVDKILGMRDKRDTVFTGSVSI